MKYFSSVLFLFALILVSCSEDDSGMNMPPSMTAGEVTNITRTACTLSANIANDKGRSIKESGFIYSTSAAFENMALGAIGASVATKVASAPTATNGTMQQAISGLSPNTTYYYCGYATSGYSEIRSEVKTFTTKAETAPVLSNLSVGDITISSATLSFSLLDFGGEDEIDRLQIWYKKLTDDSTPATLAEAECTTVDASGYNATIEDLDMNTRYAACAHISTTKGRSASSAVTVFTTDNVDATFSNFQTTDYGASFKAECNIATSDEVEVVEKGVCYSRDIEKPTRENCKDFKTDDSDDKTKISVTVEGLNDKATYNVRPYVLVSKKGKTKYLYGKVEKASVEGKKEPLAELNACEVKGVAYNSITVACSVKGAPKISERGFCYVEGKGTPTKDNNRVLVPVDGTFEGTLTGLKPNTEYTIRAFAQTESGYSYSDPITQSTSKKAPESGDNPHPGKQ